MKINTSIGIVLWSLLGNILKTSVVTRKQTGLLNYFGGNKMTKEELIADVKLLQGDIYKNISNLIEARRKKESMEDVYYQSESLLVCTLQELQVVIDYLNGEYN